ncbi:hypothetical protein [Micromonospora musae]|uniref:hypothetical protein n=1 Tax=Micromonospora musae TaxID=1894970 RepID=UPI0011C3BCB7|nr:hypothetical protein [Micromonospora musae]
MLAKSEATALLADLSHLWRLTYGQAVGDPLADLAKCKKFFDPLTRGQSLRERLAELPSTPTALRRGLSRLGPPTVIDGGDDALLVGVEGRLLIEILEAEITVDDDFIVISPSSVTDAEHKALAVYRSWCVARLTQVIDLRSGRGKEVMQAISVGVVLALLVNRSDGPEKAVVQPDPDSPESELISSAVFSGAERFAKVITGSDGRSTSEQRLRGGYGVSEARRRLAPKLAVAKRGGDVLVYIPAVHRAEVVDFIARDLARRPGLTEDKLAVAFDQLAIAFRAKSGNLAHQSMNFERPADTMDLRASLLSSFTQSRKKGEGRSGSTVGA